MPTLQRFGSISVQMFADDHPPPHVHIVGWNFRVVVRITDGVIIAGYARPDQIREALAWVRDQQSMLIRLWAELNERV